MSKTFYLFLRNNFLPFILKAKHAHFRKIREKKDLKEEENKTLDLTRDTLLITLIMNPEYLI